MGTLVPLLTFMAYNNPRSIDDGASMLENLFSFSQIQ
jgi:hypothetical protein